MSVTTDRGLNLGNASGERSTSVTANVAVMYDHADTIATAARKAAGWALHHGYGQSYDRDDLTQIAAEACCRAAQRWDPDRDVPLGIYLRRRARGAIMDRLRQDTHYDRTTGQARGQTTVTPLDELIWMADPATGPEDVVVSELGAAAMIDRLDGRDRGIIERRISDWTLLEIGDHYGITESRVSQLVKAMRPTFADA